jgi:acetyl esterase/lipase
MSSSQRRCVGRLRCLFSLILACTMAYPRGEARAHSSAPRAYKSSPVDTAHGDREVLVLWPGGAPGALGTAPEDIPKLTVYPASRETASGAAMVVCPGGGYRGLASDKEGRAVAEWLNALGVSAFVLQYRVGPRYRHPVPLQDAQRAVRLVRHQAGRHGIDPARVGIIGFSAGGHLAATVGTLDDEGDPSSTDPLERLGSRPDFMVLGYPVISMTGRFVHRGSRTHLLGESPDPKMLEELSVERRVTERTPPTFLFHTADDASVPVENSLSFYQALLKAKVPGEMHLFPHGRHGVGLAADHVVLNQWPAVCAAWMRSLGLLR